MPIPPLSFSAGGGGPSGASANNGISLPLQIGFNFDHSAWVVNNKSSGTTTASGNKDANSPTMEPSTSGGLGSSGMMPMLLLGAGAWLLLRG